MSKKKSKGVGTILDPYAGNVLNPEDNLELVKGLKQYASRGHVPVHYICNKSVECSDSEIDWIRDFRAIRVCGVQGLVMEHHNEIDVSTKMQEMAGLLIRNEIDGVYLSVQDVLSRLESRDGKLDYNVLLIPNFFTADISNGKLPYWKINLLSGLLISRGSQSKTTILGVEDLSKLTKEYGKSISDTIQINYDMSIDGVVGD